MNIANLMITGTNIQPRVRLAHKAWPLSFRVRKVEKSVPTSPKGNPQLNKMNLRSWNIAESNVK